MASLRKELRDMSLDELANQLESQDPGTPYHRASMAEFMFRQADWQKKAADAQCKAADATQATAESTAKSARYILWSVGANVLLAFIAALSLWLGR